MAASYHNVTIRQQKQLPAASLEDLAPVCRHQIKCGIINLH
jgi:hypothetical protein